MKSKENFLLQITYQILILGVPLIMAPILTRTLGADAIGIYSFTNSIAYYFICLAMLGIRYHGTRVLAAAKNDINELRKKFWNLFTVHSIFSIIALILYVITCVFISDYKIIFLIQSIYVFSAFFDITWLFYGLENFKGVVIRNAIVKILEVIFVIIFLKMPEDLPIYTLIMCVSTLMGQLIMFISILKNIPFVKPTFEEMKPHIKPIIILSISTFSYAIYTMIDKTILGILATPYDVAIYDYSEKLAKMPNTIITSLGIVMLPRTAVLFSKNNINAVKNNIYNSMILTHFMVFGSIFGLAAIADTLSIVYYGEEFLECGMLICLLTPIIFIVCFGNVIRSQYLLPQNRDKEYNISILLSAVINITLNFVLVYFIGVYGAIISTIIAEAVGLICQLYFVRKELEILKYFIEGIPFLIIGIIMFIALKFINTFLNVSITSLVILIIFGLIMYSLLSLIYIYIFKRSLLKILIKKETSNEKN